MLLSAVFLAVAARAEEFTIYGKPRLGYPVVHIGYELGYKSSHRCALWLAHRLTPAYSTGDKLYKQEELTLFEDPFVVEKALKGPTPQAVTASQLWPLPLFSPADALGRGIECEKEAYLLSNVLLQDPDKVTRQLWKETEKLAREWAKEFQEVWIVAGPVFPENPRRVGSESLAVPDAFYKIIIRKDETNGVKTVSFKIPQCASNRIETYVTTVDAIEADTGLDLLADLPDDQETAAESAQTMTLSLPKAKPVVTENMAVPDPNAAVPENAGDVWVFKEKGIYYRRGSPKYGIGEGGTFMGEAEAQLLGFSASSK